MAKNNVAEGAFVCERWCKCSKVTSRCDCRRRRFGRICNGCGVFLKKVSAEAIASAAPPAEGTPT